MDCSIPSNHYRAKANHLRLWPDGYDTGALCERRRCQLQQFLILRKASAAAVPSPIGGRDSGYKFDGQHINRRETPYTAPNEKCWSGS